MAASISGTSQFNFTVSTSVYSSNAVNRSDATEKSKFDTLKEAFPGVNFVTGTSRDPLAGKNAKACSTNTVYLDDEALRKLESDSKYAAYVLSEIETSLTYAKGYTLRESGRITQKSPGAVTMSFYGRTETSAGASSTGSYSCTDTSKSAPTIFSMLLNKHLSGGTLTDGTINSFRQLSNSICQTRNDAYRKWAGKFDVPSGEGYYVDAKDIGSKAQSALSKAGK